MSLGRGVCPAWRASRSRTGRKRRGAACLLLLAAVVLLASAGHAAARGEQYIEAYNQLVRMLTNRCAVAGASAGGLSFKSPDADSLTQSDLETLRITARGLMGFFIAPPPFRTAAGPELTDAFPYLSRVLSERGGKFLCIPAGCTPDGQPIYRDSFWDEVPVLWEHFQDLREVLGKMQYTLRGGSPPRGLGCQWVSNGEMNAREGSSPYGCGSWGEATSYADTAYGGNPPTSQNNKEPWLMTFGLRVEKGEWPDSYLAYMAARFAYFSVTDVPALPHAARFYARATAPVPLIGWRAILEWDNSLGLNGLELDRWVEVGPEQGAAASHLSEKIGSIDRPPPSWCTEPWNPQDYGKGDCGSARGLWVHAAAMAIR